MPISLNEKGDEAIEKKEGKREKFKYKNTKFSNTLSFIKKNENIVFLILGLVLGYSLLLGKNMLLEDGQKIPEMITQQTTEQKISSVVWFMKGLSVRDKYKSTELCVFDTINKNKNIPLLINEFLGEINKIPVKNSSSDAIDPLVVNVELEALEAVTLNLFPCKDSYRY